MNNFLKIPMSHCPANHSDCMLGRCSSCAKEHFIREFNTWSSGDANIDRFIQESQIYDFCGKLQWISYDNFQNIEHIGDSSHGSVNSAKLKNGIKEIWNFTKQDWEYDLIGIDNKVALKEIKDSRYDIAEFLKVVCFFIFKIEVIMVCY